MNHSKSYGKRRGTPARGAAKPAAPSAPVSPKRSETKLCGLPAVLARWRRDPSSFVRLYFDNETGRKIGVVSRALAAARKVYRCVETQELEKIAGSVHHGGIVAVVRDDALSAPRSEALASWARKGEGLLLLDRIGNTHNLGALVRSAAFFGIRHVVIPDHPGAARPCDSAYRVAEGGFEALTVWMVPSLEEFIPSLVSAGYEVVGAATRNGEVLQPGGVSSRQGEKRSSAPVALVLGNEEHGLSDAVVGSCTRRVTLAGCGDVESLNVSVAGAILIWELLARRR